MENLKQQVHELVTGHPVVLFMKGTPQFPTCGFSSRAAQVLKACGLKEFKFVNVLMEPRRCNRPFVTMRSGRLGRSCMSVASSLVVLTS